MIMRMTTKKDIMMNDESQEQMMQQAMMNQPSPEQMQAQLEMSLRDMALGHAVASYQGNSNVPATNIVDAARVFLNFVKNG
jgi:hypothetical protein